MDRLSRRRENREMRLDIYLEGSPDSRDISTERHVTSRYGISPRELLAGERDIFFKQIEGRAIKLLGDDSEGLRIFHAMLGGAINPRDIAADLELTVGQINNAKRRIRRTLGSELGQLLELFDERPSAVPEER
jgi:hypothetical protein